MRYLVGLLGLLAFLCPAAIAATNETGKVINAGFEEGHKLPDGWTTYSGGLCVTFIWDRTTAHTGQRSVYVSNADRDGSGAWTALCKVRESTSCRFAVWVKIRKGKGQGITLLKARGRAKGMAKKWEATSEGKSDTGGKWQLLEWVFTTPPGMEQVELWLWNVNGSGDQVWFDDVEFGEVTPPGAPGNGRP